MGEASPRAQGWAGCELGGWMWAGGAGRCLSVLSPCHLSTRGDKWLLGIYSDSPCSAEHLADRGGGAWLSSLLFAKDKKQPQPPER